MGLNIAEHSAHLVHQRFGLRVWSELLGLQAPGQRRQGVSGHLLVLKWLGGLAMSGQVATHGNTIASL